MKGIFSYLQGTSNLCLTYLSDWRSFRTVTLTKNSYFHSSSKHIDVRFLYHSEILGTFSLESYLGEDQLADILAKPLSRFDIASHAML